MVKLYDFRSLEKEILLERFQTMPLMDPWIASLIENYIYGIVEEFYSDNCPKLKYMTKFEKKHGEYMEWYPNGQIGARTNYIYGQLDGMFITWYPNGAIRETSEYSKGKRNGYSKTYYVDGIPKNHSLYIDNHLNSLYYEWYHNGNLSLSCSYKNGQLDGNYKEYYINGNIKLESQYNSGALLSTKEYNTLGREI